MRIVSPILVRVTSLATATAAQPTYESSEFNDPASPIPVLFTCMHAGHILGAEPAAIDIGLSIAIDETGASDVLLGQWTGDVVISSRKTSLISIGKITGRLSAPRRLLRRKLTTGYSLET